MIASENSFLGDPYLLSCRCVLPITRSELKQRDLKQSGHLPLSEIKEVRPVANPCVLVTHRWLVQC